MDDLQKKIAGDWFDIKEIADNFRQLEEYFDFSLADYRETSHEIRLSVEEGIIEYKRRTLMPLLSFLESLKYDSKGLEILSEHAKRLAPLLYSMLIQRLIAKGTIPLKKEEVELDRNKKLGIKEIIQDVNERIKEDPKAAQHPSIKNILMQVSIYKRELEDMKKLSPNIPKEKAEAFSRNFKNIFSNIHQSIEENYAALLKEEMQSLRETMHTHPLESFDLKPLAKLFMAQAQEISRVRSTLMYAEKEGFQTRSLLVDLVKEKQQILLPIANEKKTYQKWGGGEDEGTKISRAFGSELINMFERQIKRLSREEEG